MTLNFEVIPTYLRVTYYHDNNTKKHNGVQSLKSQPFENWTHFNPVACLPKFIDNLTGAVTLASVITGT